MSDEIKCGCFVALAGGAQAALAGALLAGLPALGASLEATRTAVFLHITLAQLVLAFPARRFAGSPRPNRVLLATVAGAALLQLAALLVPPLRSALGVVPLAAGFWPTVGASVALGWAAAEAARWLACRPRPAGTSHATEPRRGGS